MFCVLFTIIFLVLRVCTFLYKNKPYKNFTPHTLDHAKNKASKISKFGLKITDKEQLLLCRRSIKTLSGSSS